MEAMATEVSLYERLGGAKAVDAVVRAFYLRVLADPVLARFFEHIDKVAQVRKQNAFMARVFGGPDAYKGRNMTLAHRKLVREEGLSDVHFDAVAGHLQAALEQAGVAASDVAEILTIVESTRDQVLDRA